MQNNSFLTRYNYIKPLGKGGCGEVFLAESRALGNLWAVKKIPKDSETTISGYIEPEVLKRLNHPALPRICDVQEDNDYIYIIEDFIEGVCLKQELDSKKSFKEKTVIDWGIQLCSVLEYLHGQKPNSIIYGDMKPHNIILTADGFVKLIDFGVASFKSEDSEMSGETVFIGTKGYSAPEQYFSNTSSRASDIYSLGITLIQLITGIDPLQNQQFFLNDSYTEVISEELSRVLQRCINPRPELRYPSAAQLMKELRQLYMYDETNEVDKSTLIIKPRLTKLILFCGASGTGVSTMTATFAEFLARESTKVCLVDLSKTGRLEKSLSIKKTIKENKENPSNPSKITSNLYYLKIKKQEADLLEEMPGLYKQLSELQDKFSYLFLDCELHQLSRLEPYVNNIFLVSDMNPYNIAEIGTSLELSGLSEDIPAKTSFIINKFYRGEISSVNLLEGILLKEEKQKQLQALLCNSKIFEVPYDSKVYIRWMYSCFGEQMRFKNMFSEKFDAAISKIISGTIHNFRTKDSRFKISRLLNCLGGIK